MEIDLAFLPLECSGSPVTAMPAEAAPLGGFQCPREPPNRPHQHRTLARFESPLGRDEMSRAGAIQEHVWQCGQGIRRACRSASDEGLVNALSNNSAGADDCE